MSPEDMQRTMQFLINQQAQFEANFAKYQAQWEAQFERLSGKTERIADGLIGLTTIVGQLAAAQLRTDEELREFRESLRESMRETDARLNIVIEMFERHLREDHGQTPPS